MRNSRGQKQNGFAMIAHLIIPSLHSIDRRYRLQPRSTPPAAGFRVLNSPFFRVLDGDLFQDLRDVLGATVETNDVEKAARLLRLPADEPGLVPLNRRSSRTEAERPNTNGNGSPALRIRRTAIPAVSLAGPAKAARH
jgi:hypothetical protein